MKKRYFIILMVLLTLIGCYFFMFRTPSNEELYNKYYTKVEKNNIYSKIDENKDLNIEIEHKFINNKYHYVITFTSNKKLNDFKAMAVNENKELEYYPTFGIFDNKGIDLVSSSPLLDQTKGINLVVSLSKEIENFKIYVSYDNQEFYYLINV